MNTLSPKKKRPLYYFFTFLIGPADRFSLENRIFSALMLTIVLLCAVAAGVNASVGLPFATVLVMALGVVFFGLHYIASRVKGVYRMHVWPAALGTLVMLAVLWIYNGGSTGGAHLFLIIAPILFILFIKDWLRMFFLVLYIGVTALLLVVEYAVPGFVQGVLPRTERFWDILASTVQTQLVVAVVMVWAVRQYQRLADRLSDLRKKSEERFNDIANQIPVAIGEVDLAMRITYANRMALETTGYTVADVAAGISLEKIVTPETLTRIRQGIAAQLDGKPTSPREYEIITRSGEKRTMFGSASLIFEGGAPCGFRASLLDITEMKQLEERLHQAEKMESIGILAGGIAHDFNNILTGILTAARMIESQVATDIRNDAAELKKNAEIIASAASRAADLVRNLLVFSRHGHRESVPFDCNAAVRETVALLSRTLDKKIEISLDACDDRLVVVGDQSLLESALLNLAVNAQDAMPTGGILTIRTFRRNPDAIQIAASPHLQQASSFVAISVSDTGKGIDERVREHLFEPFVTTKETGKGTGLGLASVYGTVQSLGGCIDVESAEGHGTTFTIYLPQSDRQVALDTPSRAAPVSGSGETVLLIDDEEIILRAGEMALRKLGYAVHAFSDPALALDFFRDRHGDISCVVLDMVMPKMNGRACLARLREIDPGVKVVIATGFSGDPDFDAFIRDCGAVFVSKPFDAGVVARAICKAINEHR